MTPESPCIKICKLQTGVCVGCRRTQQEIVGWVKFSDAEKRAVLARLQTEKST